MQLVFWYRRHFQSIHFDAIDCHYDNIGMFALSFGFGELEFRFQNQNHTNCEFIDRFQLLTNANLNFIVVLATVIVGIMILFFFCFFGKLATESFEKMTICLFECNWLEFPIDVQKCILLMIQNAQRPMYYHGLGIAVLNLEIFSKVIAYFRQKTWSRNNSFDLVCCHSS